MTDLRIEYDDARHLAVAAIAGQPVRFRGTREAAERYFADLAKRVNERGLCYTQPTSAAITIRKRRPVLTLAKRAC